MKSQSFQKQEIQGDTCDSNLTRRKYSKKKLVSIEYPKIILPSQDRLSIMNQKPKYIQESVTHTDLLTPISTHSIHLKSKRSASVMKLPSYSQESKILNQEIMTMNQLKQNISKVVDGRVSKIKRSVNDHMSFMNRRGILDPSANQLRADSFIESESFKL